MRGKKTKHLKKEFRISVITGDEFLIEKQMLAKHDLFKFDVKELPETALTAARWMEQNAGLELVTNLTRKATVIAKGKSATMKEKFLNQMVKDYTAGSVVLSKLEQEMPEVFEEVMKRKTDREGELETASATNSLVPGKFFDATLTQYKAELRGVSGISSRAARCSRSRGRLRLAIAVSAGV